MMIVIYYYTKTLISFYCKRGLNFTVVFDIGLKSQFFLLYSLFFVLFISLITFFGIIHESLYYFSYILTLSTIFLTIFFLISTKYAVLNGLYISSSTRFKKKKRKLYFFKFFGFAPFAIYYLMVLDLDLMVGSYNATFLL